MSASKRRAEAGRHIPKFNPNRPMIAGAFRTARVSVNARLLWAPRHDGTQENVVKTQTAVVPPTVLLAVPERIHRFFGMEREWRRPTLRAEAVIPGATLRLQ